MRACLGSLCGWDNEDVELGWMGASSFVLFYSSRRIDVLMHARPRSPTSLFLHIYVLHRWDLQKGPLRHMDRLPVAHSGPILTLDWSNAASSARGGREDVIADEGLGGMTGSSGGGASAGSTAGGWIVSGGLDRTVKVRRLSRLLSINVSLQRICYIHSIHRTHAGMGRIPLTHPAQADIHPAPCLSRAPRALAPGIRMRARHHLERRIRHGFGERGRDRWDGWGYPCRWCRGQGRGGDAGQGARRRG